MQQDRQTKPDTQYRETDRQHRQYRETVCHQQIQQDMQDINADKTAGLTERWSEEGMTVGRKDDRTDGGEGWKHGRKDRETYAERVTYRDRMEKSETERQAQTDRN